MCIRDSLKELLEEWERETPRADPQEVELSAEDIEALIQGLAEGVIDCIASDHAPHLGDEKALEFDQAPFGVIGLETILPVALTELYHKRGWKPTDVIERLTAAPARILNIEAGSLSTGMPANIVVIDPNAEFTVSPDMFHSLSDNSAFIGSTLKGRAVMTVRRGSIAAQIA